MNKFDLAKFSSGKFWLTIISGIVFAWCAMRHVLNSEAISAILSMVFISYFQKSDKAGSNEKNSQVDKTVSQTKV